VQIKPNIKAPTPIEHTTNPMASPFLAGIWVQGALRAAGNINPLPRPNPAATNKMKMNGDWANVAKMYETIIISPPIIIDLDTI
jgi:hypothetical protein